MTLLNGAVDALPGIDFMVAQYLSRQPLVNQDGSINIISSAEK